MRDRLHDKIDTREALAAEAQAIIDRAKASFADVFERTGGDIKATLEALAALVEEDLTDLTSKAVRAGFDGAKKVRGG